MSRNDFLWLNILRYALLVMVAVMITTDIFAAGGNWWLPILLLAFLGIWMWYGWPKRNPFPYVLVSFIVFSVLIFINPLGAFLGFNLGAEIAILYERRYTFRWLAAAVIVIFVNSFIYYGLQGLPSALLFSLGIISFSFMNVMRLGAVRSKRQLEQLYADLEKAHQQLQSYAETSREFAVIQERNRIARDLHDSVKQQAFAAAAQIAAAKARLSSESKNGISHLDQAERLVENIRTELTEIIEALSPTSLVEKGISKTIEEYAVEWQILTGIETDFQSDLRADLAEETGRVVLRILQEALSNVSRHSQASHLLIRLFEEKNCVKMKIIDDGRGFNPLYKSNGRGIPGMKERAALLDGTLDVQSTPGEGTIINLAIPIKPRET